MRTFDKAFQLLDSCVANDLVLKNIPCDTKNIHLATWTGPGDRSANQNDFLAMRRAQPERCSTAGCTEEQS